tara:strand:+ start:87 stop:320 length:234 start_codon:yes stop_codon:yes gene_type:complete
MPSIACKCGNRISWSLIPNPIETLAFPDTERVSYSSVIASGKLYEQTTSIMECDECSRLVIFWDGFKHNPVFYKKEK